jgi:uncharacterized damage-inducible protein DinB
MTQKHAGGHGPERPRAPRTGDERATLHGWLAVHRATLTRKVHGVTEEQGRWSPVGSGTSLLGILAHLTAVEAWWFRVVLDGQKVQLPWSSEDPDGEWRVPEDATVDGMLRAYRAECARSDMAIALHELSETVAYDGGRLSTRWILTHMVEETARHNGHADIIRELIDGQTGD